LNIFVFKKFHASLIRSIYLSIKYNLADGEEMFINDPQTRAEADIKAYIQTALIG
jgi:hypothetical protein